jgi:pyruvate/2-oxoglutarate dehydrogenase complex dihydrolipoamide dehydrogenase (E3) component
MTDDPYDRILLENVRPPDWRNPQPARSYALLIIGGGPEGVMAAINAASRGATVALIERNRLGGECLSYGCVPSKTLIRTSRVYAEMRNADRFGATIPADIRVDFPAAMERMRRIRARISQGMSAQGLRKLGIDVFFGEARFVGPSVVEVDGVRLRFRKALIATGSRPIAPEIPGLAEAGYLTNRTVFDLAQCPRRLLVIGGGPLGCELAQAFCRLGAKVTIVQKAPMFLRQEERDAAQILFEAFERDGLGLHLNTEVVKVRIEGGSKVADLVSDDHYSSIAVDEILLGAGRAPNVGGINLEAVGVEFDLRTGIRINDFLQTTNRRIYAAGDVCFEHTLTHIEEATARMVVQNALFSGRKKLSALAIPWCIYTDPEIAHVGMYVPEALEKDIPVKTFTVLMHQVDRAITDGEEHGFVKIHVKEGTDTILGATVVASHAGEIINHLSLAIAAGVGLAGLAKVVHAYPTQAGAVQMAAQAYVHTRLTSPRGRKR